MNTLSYRTQSATPKSINKEWILIDADSQPLGRLASQVATIIRGKNKPYFTPHVDCGDNVIIINAEKIRFTGKKWDRKNYISHTGYPGGQKSKTPRELRDTSPVRILEYAVKGMLPKTSLGRRLFHHMFIYPGQQHSHIAQQPKEITLTY